MGTLIKVGGIMVAALIVVVTTYMIGAKASRHKIDKFCESIGPVTTMRDLRQLASDAGVELHGPMKMGGPSGNYLYAIAADGFTMGDYACSVHGDIATGKITAKHGGF